MDRRRAVRELLDELDRWRVRAARGSGRARVPLRELSAASGVPRSSLSDYLSGATLMPVDVLDAVVLALGATPEQARDWATDWEQATAVQGRRSRNDVSGPRQLPADTTVFTGRQRALRELDGLLDSGSGGPVVLSAIAGTAGVGKTALAVRWAHTVRERFDDGQLYVNLRGYDPGEPMAPGAVLDGFLRALGVQTAPVDLDERGALYRSLLSEQRVLIVLDNARTPEQVRPLLPGAPGCLVLVTSRDGLAGLVARDGARRVVLDRLSAAEATDLLARLLGRDRVLREPQACADLVRLCAGLPLALRVAAERVSRHDGTTLAGTVAELADQSRTLDLLDAAGDPLTDVRAVFSWSYRALPEPAARMFRLLGLHPGPDTDAHAAANLAAIPLPHARRLLDALADTHLIERGAGARYTLHDLLRTYAAEVATATEPEAERAAAVTRLLDWYVHTVSAAMDLVNPNHRRPAAPAPVPAVPGPDLADGDAAREWLEAERAGILAATRQAGTAGWPGHSWRLSATLWSFYFMAGHTTDWAESHRYGLAAARAADDAFGQAEILHAMGTADAVAGRYDEALEHTRDALEFRRSHGEPGHEAATLSNLASVHHDLGQIQRSVEIYVEALARMREAGDGFGEGRVVQNLGLATAALGRHREAVAWLTEALIFQREHGDRGGQANTLSNIAVSLSQLGDHDGATEAAAEAMAVAEETGARHVLIGVCSNTGNIYTRVGLCDLADEYLSRALDLARDIGDRGEETEAIVNLGANALRRGDAEAALALLEQARALCDELGLSRLDTRVQLHLGEVHLVLEDLDSAQGCFEQVLLDGGKDAETLAVGRAEYGVARVLLARDLPDPKRARERLERASRILAAADLPEAGTVQAALQALEEGDA